MEITLMLLRKSIPVKYVVTDAVKNEILLHTLAHIRVSLIFVISLLHISETSIGQRVFLISVSIKGERPFKCKYCDMAFTVHSALFKHTRSIHTKDAVKRFQVTMRMSNVVST